jgi:hypothetical protein
MPLFLPPGEPITTCVAGTCEGCPVADSLRCHFGGRELASFLAVAAAAFVFGGIGVALAGAPLLMPCAAIILACFGLVEIRVLCSHCPHYAEPETSSLRCWANYGSPKLWGYRPGPMSALEKVIFVGALCSVVGYPAVFMLAGGLWLLLGLFALSVAGLAAFMAARMCSHCMNFACPFNRVDAAARKAFLDRNPSVARAWGASARD